MRAKKKQILVVEDDRSLCSLIEKILEPSFRVKAMGNPVDAWGWLSNGNHPHVIVTDLKMPHVDGLDLVESLKTSGIYRETPIIVVSGSSDPKLFEMCTKWGINAFLPKPFNPEQLLSSAHAAVETKTN